MIVYSRKSDDGKTSVVLSSDVIVASGSTSMLTDGNLDIKTADNKYEDATKSEYFYTYKDYFNALDGTFDEAGTNDISYEGDLDETTKKFIDTIMHIMK